MQQSNKEMLGILFCAGTGLAIFPPILLVGVALSLKLNFSTYNKELKEEKKNKLKKKERNNTMTNFNLDQSSQLPIIRNPRQIWDDNFSFTHMPTLVGRPRTKEDVEIANILANVEKRRSDNEAARAIAHDLLHSPLALESRRENPHAQPSVVYQTEEEQLLWGFLRIVKRITRRVQYKD